MKTLYYCEICNKSFEHECDCAEHEKLCHELHDKGFEIARKLNEVFAEARKLDVKMQHGGNREAYYCHQSGRVGISTIN